MKDNFLLTKCNLSKNLQYPDIKDKLSSPDNTKSNSVLSVMSMIPQIDGNNSLFSETSNSIFPETSNSLFYEKSNSLFYETSNSLLYETSHSNDTHDNKINFIPTIISSRLNPDRSVPIIDKESFLTDPRPSTKQS